MRKVVARALLLILTLYMVPFEGWGKSSNPPAIGKVPPKFEGWALKMHSKAIGLITCNVTQEGVRWDCSVMIIIIDKSAHTVTMADRRTRKCFSFPDTKFNYYMGLIGFQGTSPANRDFYQRYKLSEWKQCRKYKLGEVNLVEYERHVLNPPRGRTRTDYVSIATLPHELEKYVGIYGEIIREGRLFPKGYAVEYKTVLTNPPDGWVAFSLDSATRKTMTPQDISLPDSDYKKVRSISEMLVREKSQDSPLDELNGR